MSGIFRKDIEPRCIYCSKSADLGDDEVICVRRGIVGAYDACRAFRYDPLKRVPPKPVRLSKGYDESDFRI